jgi:hypothetical protein
MEGFGFERYDIVDMIIDVVIIKEAKGEETVCHCA